MFAVIYRNFTIPGRDQEFQTAWRTIASYFVDHRGALGSALHRTDDGMWVAYSRWPDRTTRDRSWPGDDAPSTELPNEVRSAITTIQSCIDQERKLPDICMDLVDDLLLD